MRGYTKSPPNPYIWVNVALGLVIHRQCGSMIWSPVPINWAACQKLNVARSALLPVGLIVTQVSNHPSRDATLLRPHRPPRRHLPRATRWLRHLATRATSPCARPRVTSIPLGGLYLRSVPQRRLVVGKRRDPLAGLERPDLRRTTDVGPTPGHKVAVIATSPIGCAGERATANASFATSTARTDSRARHASRISGARLDTGRERIARDC